MFYQNLGGTSGNAILTSGDLDPALFPTLQSFVYWSGTEVNSGFSGWSFNFFDGSQSAMFVINGGHVSWALHDGNVGAVPLPAAVWLLGSGLLGLIGISKRKKAA